MGKSWVRHSISMQFERVAAIPEAHAGDLLLVRTAIADLEYDFAVGIAVRFTAGQGLFPPAPRFHGECGLSCMPETGRFNEDGRILTDSIGSGEVIVTVTGPSISK
jgi:hypothetical protein